MTIDYNQLAVAAIAQAAQAAAAAGGGAGGGAPAAPAGVARYAGDGIDFERLESHVSKWLSTNCADVNATVLQNVRLFMDHISNVYKEKVLLYETRDDMERILPDAGIRQTGDDTVVPPVDCVSGLLDEPLPFDDCLLPPEQLTRWSNGTWRPTEAIACSGNRA